MCGSNQFRKRLPRKPVRVSSGESPLDFIQPSFDPPNFGPRVGLDGMAWRIGVDIGGTFTDVALVDDVARRIGVAKTLTTPRDFAQGVLTALQMATQRYGVAPPDVGLLAHATTVVANALLEERGARAALVTTKGFRDVLELRRSARAHLYDMFQDAPRVLVPRRRRFEIAERVGADGKVVTPLAEAEIDGLIAALKMARVEAVAVSLIFSFLNGEHERRLGGRLRAALPGVPIYLSCEVLPEIREFERASTTAVCAYVGPILASYLARLEDVTRRLGLPRLYVMGSNGGVLEAAECAAVPAMTVESGPAAGVVAAALAARQTGRGNFLSFDMGGTTAKASLIRDGQYETTPEYEVGGDGSGNRWMHGTGHPIRVPVIDLAEVSAGGGSIAWVDRAGSLRVGPKSAGAEPGPACYRRGGTEPTVTDCNLLLGYLDNGSLLAGDLPIDFEAAEMVIREKLAKPLGIDARSAAAAVIDIVNHAMAEALKIVSVQRGHDPRDFAIAAFGGAGPLHAAAIAREIAIPKVVIPRLPGNFSALGMLMADWRQDFVRTLIGELDRVKPEDAARAFADLQGAGEAALERDGLSGGKFSFAADLRYRGQEHTIAIAVATPADLVGATDATRRCFDEQHDRRHGHAAPDQSIEIVNLRLVVTVPRMDDALGRWLNKPWLLDGTAPVERRAIVFNDPARPVEAQIFWRPGVMAGTEIEGPAVIEESNSTTFVPPGDRAVIDPRGNIVITIAERG